MDKRKDLYLLIFLVVLLFIINYSFFDEKIKDFLIDKDSGFVERVIDGDTIVSNATSIRLLGINSPEKKEKYYREAKEFLEEWVLNKTVVMEFGNEKYDRYNRILAYIFIKNKNVNLELVKKGFANFYFPSGKDKYYKKFKEAWEKCVEDNINLCEASKNKCADCISLKDFNHQNQEVIFENICDFDCNLGGWEIKDEGRKKFVFSNFVLKKKSQISILVGEGRDNENILFWKRKTYVWTRTGDSLFLRDNQGKLVLWESY